MLQYRLGRLHRSGHRGAFPWLSGDLALCCASLDNGFRMQRRPTSPHPSSYSPGTMYTQLQSSLGQSSHALKERPQTQVKYHTHSSPFCICGDRRKCPWVASSRLRHQLGPRRKTGSFRASRVQNTELTPEGSNSLPSPRKRGSCTWPRH